MDLMTQEAFYVGRAAGGAGIVTVSGEGSALNVADSLFVGTGGKGELTITDGAAVTVGDSFFMSLNGVSLDIENYCTLRLIFNRKS
jgi:T5SS/PEP-CTERM-associated repeat protein